MKERPILFSSVRAILDGRKTHTRRVIKPQPYGDICWKGYLQYGDGPGYEQKVCPYGQPNDRLWVKESWWIRYDARFNETWLGFDPDLKKLHPYSPTTHGMICNKLGIPKRDGKHSAIFMERWMSRITLEITDVWVERVQDITHQDAILEGIPNLPGAQAEYRRLWDSINAKRGYGWDVNPWVWVLEFRRTEK